MQFHDLLEQELERNGFDIDGKINYLSTKFQRFKRKSRPWKGRDLFVIILGGGEGACFGDWHDRTSWITYWTRSYESLSLGERKKRALLVEGLRHSEEAAKRYAIHRAGMLVTSFHCNDPSLDHPYILKKGIKPVYAGQIRSRLVIPIYGEDGKLQSVQFISIHGKKRFKRGASPAKGYLCLTDKILPNDVIRICEGWATGCSIYEIVQSPVVVAFSADNLKHVTEIMRRNYPKNRIIICADNDQWNKENTGLIAAKYCAKLFRAEVCVPDFSLLNTATKPTDFNDLMLLGGHSLMELQLQGNLSWV